MAANAKIVAAANEDPLWSIVDAAADFLKDGAPDPALFWIDGLHLSDEGFAIWTRHVRAQLASATGTGGASD